MFSSDDLRDLASVLMTSARDLERQLEKPDPLKPAPTATEDDIHRIRKLSRQLEVIRYHPLMFQDILEEYNVQAGPLDKPLEDVPLSINDKDPLSQIVMRWRFSRRV